MSFSYNYNRIAASGTYTIDFVRFTLDDTDSTAYELEDEVITALFNETSSTDSQVIRNYHTAIKAATALWRKYSKQVTFSSAGTSMQLSDRANHWWTILQQLKGELTIQQGASPVIYPQRTSSFNW